MDFLNKILITKFIFYSFLFILYYFKFIIIFKISGAMDVLLGEVIIDNLIYSARYAQPPRAVEGKEKNVEVDEPLDQCEKEGEEELPVDVLETMTHSQHSHLSANDVTTNVLSTSGSSIPRLLPLPLDPILFPASVSSLNWQRTLVTTDLDELPIVHLDEPDYINLQCGFDTATAPPQVVPLPGSYQSSASKKLFTNSYGCEENIYEEINDLQRRLALDKSIAMETQRIQQQKQCHPHQGDFQTNSRCVQPNSLIDEVMDEVARVHVRHDTVLNQLNLDFEDFLQPETPEPPPELPSDLPIRVEPKFPDYVNLRGRTPVAYNIGCDETDKRISDQEKKHRSNSNHRTPTGFLTPPPTRAPHKFMASHNRSNSSISVTASPTLVAFGGKHQLARSNSSLDFVDNELHRRPSVVSRGSTSTSSSVSSRSDLTSRLSLRLGIQQSLQKANQGISGWTEKCTSLLTRQSKKMITFVNKGKPRSTLPFKNTRVSLLASAYISLQKVERNACKRLYSCQLELNLMLLHILLFFFCSCIILKSLASDSLLADRARERE